MPSVVPPTQRVSGRAVPHSPPSRSASRLVETVVPGSRYQSTVGQNQSVYWSPVPSAHQLTMPRAGVPATGVLTVAALVVGDAVAGHGDVHGETGAAVDGTVHGGEEVVPGGFRRGRGGRLGDGVQPGQVGDTELGCRQDRCHGVPFDPALDAGVMPAGGSKGWPGQRESAAGAMLARRSRARAPVSASRAA